MSTMRDRFELARRWTRRGRRGFSLIEVMVALAVLVTGLVLLTEIQATAAKMTFEAEAMTIATQLAQEKLTEVSLMVESEGFQVDDVSESGDFDDFGDAALDLEFKALSEFHWEYLVTEVDIESLGDLSAMAQQFGQTAPGEIPSAGGPGAGGGATSSAAGAGMGLDSIINPEQITQMLSQQIREVRVRVWWGTDNPEEAEEAGTEVVLTTHVINPTSLGGGQLQNPGANTQAPPGWNGPWPPAPGTPPPAGWQGPWPPGGAGGMMQGGMPGAMPQGLGGAGGMLPGRMGGAFGGGLPGGSGFGGVRGGRR